MARINPGMPEAEIAPFPIVTVLPDGTKRVEPNLIVGPETVEQFRTGYRCIKCYCPQDEAFPERCKDGQYGVCKVPGGYEMRKYQAEEFARQFQGERAGQSWDDDFAEQDEREAWVPKSGIWLPRGIN